MQERKKIGKNKANNQKLKEKSANTHEAHSTTQDH